MHAFLNMKYVYCDSLHNIDQHPNIDIKMTGIESSSSGCIVQFQVSVSGWCDQTGKGCARGDPPDIHVPVVIARGIP